MLNTQELANFISSKLNEISSQQGFNYVFDLGAEVLENANDGHIKGILRTVSNNPMVIKDFVSAKIQYRVEFSIPVGRANKNLINIEKIIGIFVATYEDDEQAFTGGKASFEFTYAYSKDFSTQHSTGDTVPLGFDVVVNFTDTGLLGSSKVWLLNGVVIPYQTEAILLEKDGQTNRISEEYYNKSIMLAQTKFYKFTIPYDAGSSVCTTLQADLLAGDFDKTYTLSYYDGVNYTSTAPYTTTVSIFRSGAANSDGGSISMFDITFADVSAAELDPKYTIELFSVPFDETNIRFFDGVTEQAQWYNNLPATQRTKAEQIKAPTLNSIHTTTQVYDYDGTIFSQIQLANMNVARINEKKDTQTSSSYQLNFTQQTQYNGTITGNDGSSLDFEVVSTTPIIIDGVTYFLSVDAQGNYSLVDGGGNAITITNNQFELANETYYFQKANGEYMLLDKDQNVIVSLPFDAPLSKLQNFSLSNDSILHPHTYSNLTLIGFYNDDDTVQYAITPSDTTGFIKFQKSSYVTENKCFWVKENANNYSLYYGRTPDDINTIEYVITQAGDNFNGPQIIDGATLTWTFDKTGGIDFDNEGVLVSYTGTLDGQTISNNYLYVVDDYYSKSGARLGPTGAFLADRRILTLSTEPYLSGSMPKYAWIETLYRTYVDNESQIQTIIEGYQVIIGETPGTGGTNTVIPVAKIGDIFTLGNTQWQLVGTDQIVSEDNRVIYFETPEADYFSFYLSDDKFYIDTTEQDPSAGVNEGWVSFYPSSYDTTILGNAYLNVIEGDFSISGRGDYKLSISLGGVVIKVYKRGVYEDVEVADLSFNPYFVLTTDYTISSSTTILTKGNIQQNGVVVAQTNTASSPYDYQFKIEGITYYIRKNTDVYNIYYQTGVELASNVQNGGTFAIPNGEYNYYYYTIENAEMGADKQIILTLKLDTAQTYLVNTDVDFGDCFIEKTHLNRFLDNGDGTVSFNGGIESPLFEREDTQNVSKRLVSRKVLRYKYARKNRASQWFSDNILGWIYAFFPKQNIKAIPPITLKSENEGEISLNQLKYEFYDNKNTLNGQFIVLYAPIYKTNKKIVLKDIMRSEPNIFGTNIFYSMRYLTPSADFLQLFINRGANGNIFSLKFSTKPPFDVNKDFSEDFVVDSSGNLVGIPKSTGTQSGSSVYYLSNGSLSGFIPQIGNYTSGWKEIIDSKSNTSWDKLSTAEKYQNVDGMGGVPKCVLCCEKMPANVDLEDYNLFNPITFPKLNSEYIYKSFYKINRGDITQTAPQTFQIPRPSSNIERVRIVVTLGSSSGGANITSHGVPNKKGIYTFGGVLNSGKMSLQILDSVMILTILELPTLIVNSPNIWSYDSISFEEVVYGIVGASKNPVYNPKLLGSDYRSLHLTNERGTSFEYDIQKLNTDLIQTEITEQLTPDIQRTYFRVKNTDGVYQRASEENLTGLVETAETSLPICINYMKQALAEQPNYFNQRNLGMIQNAMNVGIGAGIAGAMKGGIGGAISGVIGGVSSLTMTAINNAISDDNMRKHAETVQNANGNAIFNLGYTTPGPTIEQYALLPQEERIINDQMFANGYTYNRIDNIRKFLHTRKYFNTIKAQLETIGGIPLSKAVRDDLKMRLANGLRLWHTDNIQYDLENYELWLEEE